MNYRYRLYSCWDQIYETSSIDEAIKWILENPTHHKVFDIEQDRMVTLSEFKQLEKHLKDK